MSGLQPRDPLPPLDCPVCGATGFVSYLCLTKHGFGRRQGPGGRFILFQVLDEVRALGCSDCLECGPSWDMGHDSGEWWSTLS